LSNDRGWLLSVADITEIMMMIWFANP